MVLAAAAGILLVPRFTKDPGTFGARGPGKVPWTQKVGVEVFVLGDVLVKLEEGARVAPGVALVASYHNVDRVPAYLMVFGRDSQGEIHWVYPGFADAKSDPQSVSLLPLQTRQALPDSVVLDDLPAGVLEVVSLITREPLRVSQIESLPPAERAVLRLRSRFADARIANLPVQVVVPDAKPTPLQAATPAPARGSAPPQKRAAKSRQTRTAPLSPDWMQALDPMPASKEGP